MQSRVLDRDPPLSDQRAGDVEVGDREAAARRVQHDLAAVTRFFVERERKRRAGSLRTDRRDHLAVPVDAASGCIERDHGRLEQHRQQGARIVRSCGDVADERDRAAVPAPSTQDAALVEQQPGERERQDRQRAGGKDE